MTENNAAQPGQDPLFEAIDILTVAADELRHSHTLGNSFDDWTGEPEAKAEYDRTLRVVAALSKLRAEGVQAGEQTGLYVEARECAECNHVGINDSSDTLAACTNCDWSGDSPTEDHCPGCAQDGTMTAACPKCGGQYRLLADRMIGKASAPVAMIDTAKLAQLLDSVNGDCYLGKEKEEELVQSLRSQLRVPVADSTLPLEQALYELVDKIAPGLDTGDLVHDARRASTLLAAALASAPVAGEAQPLGYVAEWVAKNGPVVGRSRITSRHQATRTAQQWQETHPQQGPMRVTAVYAAPQASEVVRIPGTHMGPRTVAVRNAALEEAAKQCEDIYSWRGASSAGVIHQNVLDACASAIRARKTQADKDGAAIDLSAVSDIALEVELRKRGSAPNIRSDQCAYELGYFNPSLPRPTVQFAHAIFAFAYQCGQADAQNHAPINRDYRVDDYDEGFERKDGGDRAKGGHVETGNQPETRADIGFGGGLLDCAKGAGDAPASFDQKARDVAHSVTFYGDIQNRVSQAAQLQCAVVEAMQWAVRQQRAALPTPSVVKQSLTATQTGEKGESDA